MLYTKEEAPQVLVEIDGLHAACVGLQCDYQYEEPVGLVTGMTVNGLDVSITGSNLTLELVSVTLAMTDCVITINTDSTIECTMSTEWTAGRWLPQVRDAKGLIPNDAGLQSHYIGPVLISITPYAELNPAGFDTLTLSGSNFPIYPSSHQV